MTFQLQLATSTAWRTTMRPLWYFDIFWHFYRFFVIFRSFLQFSVFFLHFLDIFTSKGSYRSKKKIIKVWMMMKWMGELFLLTLPLLALPLLNLPSLTFPSLSFHSLTLPLLPLLSLALPGLSTSFCVSRFYPHCWEFWVIDKLLKLLKYCFVIFSLLLPS